MAKGLTRKRAMFRLDLAAIVTGVGLGLTLSLLASTLTREDVTGTFQIITTISRVAALAGAYLALLGLLLVARITWIERAVGHDRLVSWHRKAAPYSLFLILIHVMLVALGYAANDKVRVGVELWRLVTTYPWMLPAFFGFLTFMTAGISSYKRVRSKMKYETWWTIHLYTYIGVAFSFMHQVLTGVMFIGHPLNRIYWTGLYVFVAIIIITWRVLIPVYKNIRFTLRVSHVDIEAPGIISIYVRGRNLLRLKAEGGQFFNWRFFDKDRWYESHPFSLSAAPTENQLRFTVKDLGDHSRSLVSLRPGTRVLIEGPYGAFTKHQSNKERPLVLIGGGVGITPIRALLEELSHDRNITIIYRASSEEDLIFLDELTELAAQKRARLHILPGSRKVYPLDAKNLLSLIPKFRESEIYICGPTTLTEVVRASAKTLGMPKARVHSEIFEYHAVLDKEKE
jgi:predicted ferric reductase